MDVHHLLDPEVAAALGGAPPLTAEALADLPTLRAASLARLRDAAAADPPSPRVQRTDHHVPRGDGTDVHVRVHRPIDQTGPLPCLFFIHGGGFVTGSIEQDDGRLGRLVEATGCVAVAIDYRLAPECPYPAPLDDCWRALCWLASQGAELSIDTDRLAIGGASAGGGLAAAVALRARDRGGPPLVHQFLVYPMLDDRCTTPSSQWDAPVWSKTANRFGWDAYLGEGAGAVTAEMAPGRCTDAAGLPPAFIGVGALDLFVDENLAFAQLLLHAGIPVELHVYPGAPHGFEGMAGRAAVADRLVADLHAAVRRVLLPSTAQHEAEVSHG